MLESFEVLFFLLQFEDSHTSSIHVLLDILYLLIELILLLPEEGGARDGLDVVGELFRVFEEELVYFPLPDGIVG
jgi:hypothetical protein